MLSGIPGAGVLEESWAGVLISSLSGAKLKAMKGK
jgi:hypothetical protein